MSNLIARFVFSIALAGASVTAADAASSSVVHIEVPEQAQSAAIRIQLPDGSISEHAYVRAADAASIDVLALIGAGADGTYRYEIAFAPKVDAAVVAAATAARREGVIAAAGMPVALVPVSGSFAIVNHRLVAGQTEADAARAAGAGPQPNDQVIADDLIVQGSGCFGFDCVNNEAFGFSTLRLKENSTRIEFSDTSGAGFPATSWQLTANDSAAGGLNKFSIEDLTAATVPFTVSGGAPTNAVVVAPNGKLGLRTVTPILDIHIATGDSPAQRFEQTAASGFTAQTWDVAGNEANFFVRDVTGGSRLPFRIRPGAPTSSIDINPAGNVGIGTASPLARLHVAGDAYIAGTLTQLSSRTSKTNFTAVTADLVLDRLADLPIWTWNYLRSDAGDRHIGPVAEDFYRAFGFGTSERQLAPSDVAGVALAAVQALQREVAARDRTIETLEQRLSRLEALLGERAAAADTTAR